MLGRLQDALIESGQFIPAAEWGSVTGWDQSVRGIRFEARADPNFYDAWKGRPARGRAAFRPGLPPTSSSTKEKPCTRI
ncbi:hypothetical protein GCM10029978_080690 [Actinoallomurus acanthiterrae]